MEAEKLDCCNKSQQEGPPQPNCDPIQAFVENLLAITASLCAMWGKGDIKMLQHLCLSAILKG